MTSELLSKIIQNQADSAPISPNKNFTAINQNYFLPQSILNLNMHLKIIINLMKLLTMSYY